jgi:cytochrome bd-type quinol oxidase subunit 2
MEVFLNSFGAAIPAWSQAVSRTGWHQVVVMMAYGAVAWLCLVRATIIRQGGETGHFWPVAASVLGLLGASGMLQADLFTTVFVRAMFQVQGWYTARQAVQYPALLVLAAVVVFSTLRLTKAATGRSSSRDLGALGLASLLLLLLARTVSAHGTDALLNLRASGVSTARLLEFVGLALVASGALRDPDRRGRRLRSEPVDRERHV